MCEVFIFVCKVSGFCVKLFTLGGVFSCKRLSRSADDLSQNTVRIDSCCMKSLDVCEKNCYFAKVF